MIVLAQTVGQLQETWSAILRFVPRALAFVVILVVGYLIARALARAVDSVLKRIGFDRAVRRSGINSALERSGYDAADLLAKIVFYGLVLLVLQLAFGVFGPNPVSDLLNSVIAFLPRLFVAVIIVVVAAAIAAAVRDVIASLIGPLSYGRLLAFSAYGLILGLGVFAALDQLDVAPTIVSGLFYALLAIIAGVIIVAVGGGGIAPMRQRWEHALTRMDQEAERIRETAREERERREEQRENPGKKPPKKKKPDRPREDDRPTRKGASAAIEFALDQIGDMYLWGGTGPSRWDCSGLTQGAWAKAGVYLPHYSVAQYEQVRHIDEDELRPGDLIFWSTDPDDPGTIHHVALYLGNGRMVHAPRTGKPVQIDSVYYWEPPDFFGRP